MHVPAPPPKPKQTPCAFPLLTPLQQCVQELTPRDRSLAANLSAKLRLTCPGWAEELQQMLASGCKAEIEALYTLQGEGGAAGFADFLERCLEEGEWV